MSKPAPRNDNGDCLVYDVPAAGRLLGLTRNASYAAAGRGDLPTIRIGRLLRVPKVALDRLLASADRPKAAG